MWFQRRNTGSEASGTGQVFVVQNGAAFDAASRSDQTLRRMHGLVNVNLGPVQETALLTLYARAWVSGQDWDLLEDPHAVEIVKALNFDFSKWARLASLTALAIRARVYDEQVQAFLSENTKGTVVELGAGLNTRFERVDNGQAHWIELDLPDIIDLRRAFFVESARRKMMPADLSDLRWLSLLDGLSGPFLFVSEGSLIYLDSASVHRVVEALVREYPGSRLLLDTASSQMVDNQENHDAMRTFDPSAWFRWRCDEPRALEDWGMRCITSMRVSDVSAQIRQSMPWRYRAIYTLAPWVVARLARGYRISLFELGSEAMVLDRAA